MDLPCNSHKGLFKLLARRSSVLHVILETHTDAEIATERGLLIHHVSSRYAAETKNSMADPLFLGVSVAFLMFPIPTYMHRHLY